MSKKSKPANRTLLCETLEDRKMMTGMTAVLSYGVLNITGTAGNDQITVRQINGVIRVDNTPIRIGANLFQGVNAQSVQGIWVSGGLGDDNINLASERTAGQQFITKPTEIFGGDGRDVIFGTAAVDKVFAGAGGDIVIGGLGGDILYGEAGNDTLVGDRLDASNRIITTGQDGADFLLGGTGSDRFFGQGGFDWFHDDYTAGNPFVNGTQVTDVSQKELGTCATLAAMTALVRQGYDFGQQMSYAGNNQFRINLYRNGQPVQVTVQYNGWWNDNDPRVTSNGYVSREYWPILMQRARLQMYGVDWGRSYTEQEFTNIHNATGGRLANLKYGLDDLCGGNAIVGTPNQLRPDQMLQLIRNGYAVTAGTFPNLSEQVHRMVRSHAYAVMNVMQQSGTWFIQLHNPWGIDSTFGDRGDGNNDGFVTLTWNEFVAYFSHLAVV